MKKTPVLTWAMGLTLVSFFSVPLAAQSIWFPTWRVFGFNVQLAGHDLNGISLNGVLLDDKTISHVLLEDVTLEDGEILENVALKKTKIRAKHSAGDRVRNRNLIGATFRAVLVGGDSITLRIDDIYKHPNRETHKDVRLYDISYASTDGWLPLCGLDETGLPIGSIPIPGRWDYSTGTETGGARFDEEDHFTFACQQHVLANCVEAGYKPWLHGQMCDNSNEENDGKKNKNKKKNKKKGKKKGKCKRISFADHHQACTRMMRADYCGDGISYTSDAVMINPYDGFGLRADILDWTLEAEWDTDGAVCISSKRQPLPEVSCREWLKDSECGDPLHFADGTLIISEVQP